MAAPRSSARAAAAGRVVEDALQVGDGAAAVLAHQREDDRRDRGRRVALPPFGTVDAPEVGELAPEQAVEAEGLPHRVTHPAH
jgi:hypothetical protein